MGMTLAGHGGGEWTVSLVIHYSQFTISKLADHEHLAHNEE